MTDAARRPGAWSLATRLTIYYAVSAFALVVTATILLNVSLARSLDHEADVRLGEVVAELRRLVGDRPEDLDAIHQEVDRSRDKVHVRVVDGSGATVAETTTPGPLAPPDVPVVAPGAAPAAGTPFVDATGGRWRAVAARVTARGGAAWLVVASVDVDEEATLLRGGRQRLVAVLAAALLVCVAMGRWLTRSGLSPLVEMTDAAGRIDPANLAQRIRLPGLPRELLALKVALNGTLDRLEDAFRRLGQFSQDIAHELRTPIQNLKGEIEVCLGRPREAEEYREVLTSCLEEADRLARLIDRLLFLARSERPAAQAARERVDLSELLASVRDFYEPQASEVGVAVALSVPSGLVVDVDASLTRAAVGNLLENALRHTARGGQVTISAALEDGAVRLEVRDTGEGIAAEHVPHIFDRFYRVDPSRSGGGGHVGLGLAIVESIARLHGGQARCESEVGRGTTITLLLPLAAAR